MKLFEVQTNLSSYWYPLTKMVFSFVIICLCFFRKKFLTLSYLWIDIITALASFALTILCILILYISIGEIFHTASNRSRHYHDISNAVKYTVDDVLAIVQRDDIVEIEVVTENGLEKLGASADNLYNSSMFTDKQFYINGQSYDDIYEFSCALYSMASNNDLHVLSIDGVSMQRGQGDGLREP